MTAREAITAWLLLSAGVSVAGDAVNVRIHPETEYQTIDGFGASGAWWAQKVGGWQDPQLDKVLDLLYGPNGAALTIYRFNIGAGNGENIHDPWRRTETFEVNAGTYDWHRDANAIYVLKKVRDRGVEQFVFFANSPPARLTQSGMVSGGIEGGPNLKDGAEADFASYLLDITEHWQQELGLSNVTVSPLNEPQWRWGGDGRGQEGSHYSPRGAARLLRATASEIDRRKSPVHLEGPEVARWGHETPEYLDAVLDETGLASRLHRLAIHSYFSNRDEKIATMNHLRNRGSFPPIAVTEWCEMEHGRDVGMDSALTMARVIHDDLSFANATSWQAWIAVSRYDYRDGLIYIDHETRKVIPTKRLWVAGQFSRFVRPGSVRIDAQTDDPSLLITAFRVPSNGEIVLIVINPGNEERLLQPLWNEGTEMATVRDIHRTSAKADLVPVEHTGGPLHLDPESVTTIRLIP